MADQAAPPLDFSTLFPEAQAPQAPPLAPNPETGDPNVDAMAMAVPLSPEEMVAAQQNPQAPGMSGAVAADIGKGITELPRAIVKGTRDAAQATLDTVFDVVGSAGTGVPPADASPVPGTEGLSVEGANLTGGEGPGATKAPQLPDLNKPESVTGQFAATISQFAVGMVGIGKITAGYSAATKAGRFALEAGKAATVGAVAFDPHGPRLADLIEKAPALTNPVTRWLSSDPTDSAAIGRVKNALESLGMDALIAAPLMAGVSMYRASRAYREGAITKQELEATIKATEPVASKPPAAAPLPGRDVMSLSSEATIQKGIAVPEVPMEVTENILKALRADADAIATHGDWTSAINAGHAFSTLKVQVPWNKFANMPDDLAAFTLRVSEQIEGTLKQAKGGGDTGVMSDAQMRMMVGQRAAMWNEDPAALMAMLQQAGKGARSLAANMEAAFLVTQKAHQDTFALANRIRMGDLDAFNGDKDVAMRILHQMVGVMTDSFGQATAMRAAAGRTLRRNREEFAVTQAQVDKLRDIDPNMLVDTIINAGAHPKNLARLANPSFMARLLDPAQYLLVNNLLWSPVTHGVNLITNLYNVGVRPLERTIGSFAVRGSEGSAIRQEALKQYSYMGHALTDGWRSAVKAWKAGDSVLTPHQSEAYSAQTSIGQDIAQMPIFKPHDSLANVLTNAFAAVTLKTVGLPTRALGVADEMMKQVVYRSKVAAEAHMEAINKGLTGDDLRGFVLKSLDESVDLEGRALREGAKEEAMRATFQQDLSPGTFGAGVQSFTNSFKIAKTVLPFIRTPVNVLRQGWQMTPGLNMLQTEYRNMITGAMGPQAQAQAVGQMTLGSLFMGTAAYLAENGLITGGGPSDPALRKRLMDTGWRPYSIVRTAPDGSREYIALGRFDPVAMPFGIVADLSDAVAEGMSESGNAAQRFGTGATALLVSLSKQLANKAYLTSINQVVDAIVDPDRSFGKFAQGYAANFMPLASGLRYANPDPHMRETRDLVDKLMAQTPGYSQKLPPRRNVFGEPVAANKGLYSIQHGDLATQELQRLIEESGASFGPPSPNVEGADLRDVKMASGKNAYDVYQQLAAKPGAGAPALKDILTQIMQTEAYRRAPDGDAGVRGTKLYMLSGPISKYRTAALSRMRADPEVRKALFERQQKVIEAYKATSSPSAPSPQAGSLEALGKAFGMDLSTQQPKP